jgi:hypothetical protein
VAAKSISKFSKSKQQLRFELLCLRQLVRREFDLICEEDHGCAPIPVTHPMFRALQKTDPRCKDQQSLTLEDKQALVDLAEVVKTLKASTEPERKQ